MDRIKIITSVEYWTEALSNKSYNKISDEDFAKDIVYKLNEAINYTHCCESDSEQLFCGCGKNKPVIREPAYLHCDWCGSITVETK